ncbi:MAG: XisI protein [Chloroflexaceae bacterium]|jgi:hypothetical protein|nr:XisI protein [Chloroflexaceae bacterium]
MEHEPEYRSIIKEVLNTRAKESFAHGQIDLVVSFDDEHGRYLLLAVGWNGIRRVHTVLAHVDLIDDKVWLETYSTAPPGIAEALVAAGVPHTQIVLAFHHSNIRPNTAFAVA